MNGAGAGSVNISIVACYKRSRQSAGGGDVLGLARYVGIAYLKLPILLCVNAEVEGMYK